MAETSEDCQIRTVAGPGLTLSQGPVNPLPVGAVVCHMAVRVGETKTVVGLPVQSIRRE